jgi:hypothetical protein
LVSTTELTRYFGFVTPETIKLKKIYILSDPAFAFQNVEIGELLSLNGSDVALNEVL